MASSDSQLQIVISALDNASATLKQLAANSESAMAQVSSGTDKASEAHKSFGATLEHVAANVFEYLLAYRAFEEALSTVKNFFDEAIKGALEAGDTLAQLKVNVENAGLSFEQLGPQVENAARQHVALGFTIEDSERSLGRLLLTTGNYKDALALNNLSMDLARSKNIDLTTATQLVEQVMAGNTRIMKQYGISLDSATTSAEALTILQDKVKDSASAAAETSAGKWREVQAQWQQIEVQVGDALLPVLQELFTSFEDNLPAITASLVQLGTELATDYDNIVAIGDATGIFPALKFVIEGVLGDLELFTDALTFIRKGIDDLRGVTLDYSRAQGQLSSNVAMTTSDFKRLNITTDDVSTGFGNITNRIHAADNAAVKHSDAIAKLSTEYTKMRDTGMTDLSTLTESFETKMASINTSIAGTIDKINDLSVSYAQTQMADTTRVADAIVASEQKVEDIKRQIGQASAGAQANNLAEQLNQEQLNYTSSLAFRQTHADLIAIAETRAKQTSLQRAIEDYNTKQGLDALDYQKKLTSLQQELKDKQDEATKETHLYQEKVRAIAKVLDEGQAYFNKLSADRVATTTKEVDAEIAQFARLAAAESQIKSAASTVSLYSLPLPHFASGGIVTGPTVGLIGEAGPEAIIPLNKMGAMGGGNSINITITGNNISSQLDVRSIASAVSDEIVRTLRMNQRLSI